MRFRLLILHDPQMGLDLPGGKVMENETDLRSALQREVKEETNNVVNLNSNDLESAPYFYQEIGKYITVLIKTNNTYESEEFGVSEIHDNIKRTIQWIDSNDIIENIS